jgi:hypothetical protein
LSVDAFDSVTGKSHHYGSALGVGECDHGNGQVACRNAATLALIPLVLGDREKSVSYVRRRRSEGVGDFASHEP